MIFNKQCPKCNIIKDLSEYGKNKTTKDGLVYYCKSCFKEIKKISDYKYSKTEKGKTARRKAVKNYFNSEHGHKTILKARQAPERKIKEKQYYDYKRKTDGLYRLRQNIRKRLNMYLKAKGFKKNLKFKEYIGLEPNQLKIHIESKFQEGMSWDNYGKWHIDHIIPLSSSTNELELYKLNHYSNLQPLWAKDNLSKGNR